MHEKSTMQKSDKFLIAGQGMRNEVWFSLFGFEVDTDVDSYQHHFFYAL